MAAATPLSLEALPTALARSVLFFAAGPHAPSSGWVAPEPPSRLHALAQVSKAWNTLARDVASAATLRRFFVDADECLKFTSCRSGMLELRRRAVLRRTYVREFALETRLFTPLPSWLTTLEWGAVFSAMPRLETLDLTRMPRTDIRPIAVLLVGASHGCRRLHKLVLPAVPQQPEFFSDVTRPVTQEHPQATLDLAGAMLDVLGAWHAQGGELRELNAPFDFTALGEAQSPVTTAYVDAIAASCPQIQFLRGDQAFFPSNAEWTCNGQWFINEATWERFCASCTQLKMFDWVVVPFATRFFEIFGAHAKPQLTELTLSTAMNWNWAEYLASWGLPDDAPGYGATAQHAHAALRACPNLRSLMVLLYAQEDTPEPEPELGTRFDAMRLDRRAQPRRRERVVPSREMMDQEIFGDEFCQALAQLCPRLESLNFSRVVRAPGSDARTIRSFTDVALRALATMSQLVGLELPSVNVTGAGLFDLITGFTRGEWSWQRSISLSVETFYAALEEFLRMLAASEEQLFGGSQPFALTVINRKQQVENSAYLATLHELVGRVQHKFPSMKLRIVLLSYKPESFVGIQQFSFYSADGYLNDWGEVLERIDDIFVAAREFSSAPGSKGW